MLNPLRTRGPPFEVFAGQRTIDAERRARSFCCCDDRQLHVSDDVAGYEYTRNARRLILAALDATVPCKLTTQRLGERGLTARRRIEKQSRSPQPASGSKNDFSQVPALAIEARDAFLNDPNVIPPQMTSIDS